jgi:hypothetical protein
MPSSLGIGNYANQEKIGINNPAASTSLRPSGDGLLKISRSTAGASSRSINSSLKEVKQARIGNYIVDKTLGEGNFAKVKLATHAFTGDKV